MLIFCLTIWSMVVSHAVSGTYCSVVQSYKNTSLIGTHKKREKSSNGNCACRPCRVSVGLLCRERARAVLKLNVNVPEISLFENVAGISIRQSFLEHIYVCPIHDPYLAWKIPRPDSLITMRRVSCGAKDLFAWQSKMRRLGWDLRALAVLSDKHER